LDFLHTWSGYLINWLSYWINKLVGLVSNVRNRAYRKNLLDVFLFNQNSCKMAHDICGRGI